jgi:hypothetical protein
MTKWLTERERRAAVSNLTDYVLKAWNNKEFVVGIFL